MGGYNLYSFIGNNGLSRIDILGLICKCCISERDEYLDALEKMTKQLKVVGEYSEKVRTLIGHLEALRNSLEIYTEEMNAAQNDTIATGVELAAVELAYTQAKTPVSKVGAYMAIAITAAKLASQFDYYSATILNVSGVNGSIFRKEKSINSAKELYEKEVEKSEPLVVTFGEKTMVLDECEKKYSENCR